MATIIVRYIFSMLFSDFRALGPIRIATPPIMELTEFSHADERLASLQCQYRNIQYPRYESTRVFLCK